MTLLLVIYLLIGLLILLSGLAFYHSHSQELTEKTNQNFSQLVGISIDGRFAKKTKKRSTGVETLLWRAGIEPKEKYLFVTVSVTILLMIVTALTYGLMLAISIPPVIALTAYIWINRRASYRMRAILRQLPLFLDQVLRALGTGRSMESALELAAREAQEPLKIIFERILRENQLGKDLGLALQETAEIYRLQELYLVSLAIRVNRIYGSSVRELIKNIVKMIQDREAARRELNTMTGETRVTAWVLGLLPMLIAGYILMMNPDYMLTMWQDSSGKWMLMTALVFQLIGVFALWRMIKSI